MTTDRDQQPVDQSARARTLETNESFLVQAPAGSGKTELLTRRMLKLLAEVDEPEQVLAITFTLAATAEMRERVLSALQKARDSEATGEEFQLARAALENDARRAWNLLQQPERLNIQTIDAVCLAIAHETPLLSRLGGSLSPTDRPQPLYSLAARRTLARLGGEEPLSSALGALLQLRATSLPDCQKLIAEMLDKRDQWGRVLPLGQSTLDWPKVRALLEAPLRRTHEQAFQKAQALFAGHTGLARELLEVLSHACRNVDPDSPLNALAHITHMQHLTDHGHWTGLCHFLLTKEGAWRKQANRDIGFLAGNKAAKERFTSLIAGLEAYPEFLAMLSELSVLPPQAYTEEESQMLQHMLVILRYAIAELRLVFAERGVVDFVELGLAARQVLRDDEGELSELAADVAARWPHLLVDEFQDTSRSQYELFTLIAGGWESAGRGSCFLVGDPMQSIYMFRQAEVELFERTRMYGLGEGTAVVHLTPLQLQTNFRSHAGLVNRLNEIFEQVFTPGTGEEYQVTFAPSSAHCPAPRGSLGVKVWPFFSVSRPSEEEKRAAEDAEARQVVNIIQEHWPAVETAKRKQSEFRIAVLVRARTHLDLIAHRLRKAEIPFRAVEIEQLSERQEVKDLTSLTRALLHPMDRIAWLSVLRAPWCGLTLKDLHVLADSDTRDYNPPAVLTLLRERTASLSADGQVRATRVLAVLEDALRGKHRQVSLAQWVERTWATLGGRTCVDRAAYANVQAFFAMLEQLGPEAAGLEEQIAELCAQPDPAANERCGVLLMTIHKAKGLGFDVVIVPGLGRVTRTETQPLLRWLEQTRLIGSAEQEAQEFVVAPIGRNGKQGGIYSWIGELQGRREDDEARRLLYVAATRARRELHLLGTAAIKKNGQEVAPGSSRSLLGIAWTALGPDFERARAEQVPAGDATPQQGAFSFPPAAPTIQLHRLPADWKPPAYAVARETQERDLEVIERPRGSLAARAFGTVVHALLEDLTRLPGIAAAGVSQSVLDELRSWRPRALAMLRSTGLPPAEAEPQAVEVVRALQGVLQDAKGRWILGARAGAQTETSWSGWAGSEGTEIVRTLRADRIFRAGATPCSGEETHLWIVDYKTARHGASGLDAFLEAEKQ
ncbi:MAG: ATP-dependent helicase/nuclease subunit, partial [Acidobacteriaceae bacterium]|nr:ATP-dependent helicase/nuclease subunit [Acidobacteriaceae bacterium]